MSFAMPPEDSGSFAQPVSKGPSAHKRIGALALALGLLLTVIAVSTSNSPSSFKVVNTIDNGVFNSTGDSTGDTSLGLGTSNTDWAPAGYTVWANDSNVAYEWNHSASCTDQYSCWHADFISQTGCSNFYAAINILNSSDAVVDYSNATLPSLQAMQTATLQFNDINGVGSTAQMSEINCG